jgi:predicted nucleic acid-binding protein
MFPEFVIDASVTIAGLAPAESIHDHVALMERVVSVGVVVPAIWIYEIANIVRLKTRRVSVPGATGHMIPARLQESHIRIIPASRNDLVAFGSGSGRDSILTAYNAAYLALARHLAYSLATLDRALAGDARAEGIEVV